MREEVLGEVALSVVVSAALASLALCGGPDGWGAGLLLVPAALAPWVRDALPPRTGAAILVGGGLALAAWVAAGGGRVEAVGIALVALLSHQRLAAGPERSDRLALLLAVLLLVGAGARTTDVAFFATWSALTAALPLAAWRPTVPVAQRAAVCRFRAALAAGTWLSSLALFFVLPRPPSAVLDEDPRTGLTRELALGGFDRLDDDPLVIAELRFERGGRVPLRLRAMAFDHFDGRVWTSTSPLRPVPLWRASAATHRVAVDHAPLDGVVLGAGELVSVAGDDAWLVQDVSDAWRTQAPGRVSYVAEVVLDRPSGLTALGDWERARALQLPEALDPRVAALAAEVAQRAEPAARLAAIEAYVSRSHIYSRVGVDGGADPLSHFLLVTRAGHCEYFAAAVVVLARLAGLPARLVTGFVGGEPIPQGVRMRGLHAHAWAEVHLDGQGWVVVDATTGARAAGGGVVGSAGPSPADGAAPWRPRAAATALWHDLIVRHDGARQARWLEGFSALPAPVWVGVVGALLVAVTWGAPWPGRRGGGVRVRPRSPRAGLAGSLDRASATLAARGWEPPPGLPPLEAARWVRARAGEVADPLVRLAWLHYEVTYGGAPEEPRVAEARALEEQVRAIPPPGG